METTILYRSENCKAKATLFRYLNGSEILALELNQEDNGIHGGRLSIQGTPIEMRKLLTVLGRILRNPEINEEPKPSQEVAA